MKGVLISIATVLVVTALAYAPARSRAADPWRLVLAQGDVGRLPDGWTATKTGEGPGSVWQVVADETAAGGLVLAQVSPEGPDPLFNLCVADDTRFTDIDISVRFKAVAGKLDQGGGLVWRYSDANNYYLARMNPLEDNFRVYKVEGGKRTQFATADVKVPTGSWYALRVVQAGDSIKCYLDGKLYLDVHDSTFTKPGKIGLWTKADAQTRFAALVASRQ
jgi:hypothetical protein